MQGMQEVVPVLDPERFEVLGADMQVLNLKMGSAEVITSVPGAMVYMEPSVTMDVNCNECFGRCMSGSSPIMATYTNTANDAAVVGLTPNVPAKVIPLALNGGKVFRAKEGAFFASSGSVIVGYNFDFNPATCCFGGQGCVRQTVGGEGTAFLAAMGTIMTKELAAGEQIVVDTNSVVAWSESIELTIKLAGGLCTVCCGGEGLFNTVLTGPGTVYFQSMSWKKFKTALQIAVAQNQEKHGDMGGSPPTAEDMER